MQRAVIAKDVSDGNQSFAELQQQYSTYCRLRKKQLKKRRQMRWMDSLTLAAQRCTSWWLQTNGLTLLLFLLSRGLSTFLHIVQPQESVPDVLPGQSNLTTRHQLLSDQLRSGQVFPSDIAVPPGPVVADTGAWKRRYRSMKTQQWASTCIRATPHTYSSYHCPEKRFKHECAVQPRFWSVLYFYNQTCRENNLGWSW